MSDTSELAEVIREIKSQIARVGSDNVDEYKVHLGGLLSVLEAVQSELQEIKDRLEKLEQPTRPDVNPKSRICMDNSENGSSISVSL